LSAANKSVGNTLGDIICISHFIICSYCELILLITVVSFSTVVLLWMHLSYL